MNAKQQNALGKMLWNIAVILRGYMDADDFRDYMLVLLFLCYLSDSYQKEAKRVLEVLGVAYPPAREGTTPLQRFYDENPNKVDDFEEKIERKLHYVIKPKYLWETIENLAKKPDSNLLKTLKETFEYIEEKSWGKSFKGLFDELNLNSNKLGKTAKERNKILGKIINGIANGLDDPYTDGDSLGHAYIYLIEQFASDAGKKAGEFYTPEGISTILSQIVILQQDPTKGNRDRLDKVLDFTCGSGSLLLNVHKEMDGDISIIYGQEKNITTYNLARMNMLLHGVKHSAFKILPGDTLENEYKKVLDDILPTGFDAIVANPPFSYRWEPEKIPQNDIRFKNHGLAPKSAADFAFLLHGLHYLAKNGTMAIILPHGVLFRGGTEGEIRKKLLKDNYIDAVIGLPANLFYSTGIPVCILVLKKCRKQNDDILFINAAERFEKGKRQNLLTQSHIGKIVTIYRQRKSEKVFSRRVLMAEIKDNDYNLNISRYVSTEKEELPVDLGNAHDKLHTGNKTADDAKKRHNKFLKELGLPELP